jgi:hypothetical protein
MQNQRSDALYLTHFAHRARLCFFTVNAELTGYRLSGLDGRQIAGPAGIHSG